MADVQIIRFDPTKHQHLLPSIVTLHVDSIQQDDTPLRFVPPFTEEKRAKMEDFWKQRTEQILEGRRITLVAVAVAAATTNTNTTEPSPSAVGVIELSMFVTETGPYRSDIEMLIVSPSYRRRGLGKMLMLEIERVAVEQKKTLLTFSTTRDSVAEKYLYPQLGYIEYGRLPNYARTPMTGQPVDGVYFYKDLREELAGSANR